MKKTLLLLLALAACITGAKADELTVANGTNMSALVPIYPAYLDEVGATGQVIYPAESLADMANADITMVKFYMS